MGPPGGSQSVEPTPLHYRSRRLLPAKLRPSGVRRAQVGRGAARCRPAVGRRTQRSRICTCHDPQGLRNPRPDLHRSRRVPAHRTLALPRRQAAQDRADRKALPLPHRNRPPGRMRSTHAFEPWYSPPRTAEPASESSPASDANTTSRSSGPSASNAISPRYAVISPSEKPRPEPPAARVSIPAWLVDVLAEHIATYPGDDDLIFAAPAAGRCVAPASAPATGSPRFSHRLASPVASTTCATHMWRSSSNKEPTPRSSRRGSATPRSEPCSTSTATSSKASTATSPTPSTRPPTHLMPTQCLLWARAGHRLPNAIAETPMK